MGKMPNRTHPEISMLTLNADERRWLDAYRAALDARWPGVVERIAVFGSKARGDANTDSDLDVLVLVNTDDRRVQWEVSDLGHDLVTDLSMAPDAHFFIVSIMVHSTAEWAQRVSDNALFQTEVERDAVTMRV